MGLITDPTTGAHSYTPDPQRIGQDIDSLLGPRQSRGPVLPLGVADFVEEPLGPTYPGASYFRLTLFQGNGGFQQEGDVFEVHNKMASGDMVFDKDGMGRAPFLTGSAATPDPTSPYGDRFYGATFLNTPVMLMPETGAHKLFQDTGTVTPSISAVAGFAAPATNDVPTCMEPAVANGTPLLLIGYSTAAVSALQAVTALSPFADGAYAIGAFGIYGLCFTGIDQDSVMVYTADATSGLLKSVNLSGVVVFADRARLPSAGYTVGIATIGPNPEVFHVVPTNSTAFLGPSPVPPAYQDNNFRGKLVACDLRGFVIHDVTTVLDYVVYATKAKYGIFYCNSRQHQYMTQGSDFPVDSLLDMMPNANKTRVCRGHYVSDDRIFWRVNEVDASGGHTFAYTMEFDPVLRRVRQVSRSIDLGAAGLLSVGGPRLPVSSSNRNLIDYANGSWYYQFQERSSELGFNKRHTAGSAAGAGQQYEPTTTWMTPRLRLKHRPAARFVVKRVIGPSLRNLREGGDDGYMTVAITAQPLVTFRANESSTHTDRRPVAEEPFHGNESWSYELQATITAHQGTSAGSGGADYTRYTGNYAQVTIEGILYDPPVSDIPLYSEMKGWDAAA